jgi:hypothetical protein
MAFHSYITYEEYQELGGKVSEDAFTVLVRKSQRLLDYITFDRIKYLTTIPDEVKEVLTEFIDRTQTFNAQTENGDTVSSYSNGVETLTYRLLTEDEQRNELCSLAYQWLPDYLLARSVNFNVTEYLQSENNGTE